MGIGKTNAAGGGAALNFDVKAYATESALMAATPAENTIGIITTTAITGWVFSATEPANPVVGMVWFPTSTSSVFEFNALKKNAIQVYPTSAQQYVDNAWVSVRAYSYQGGEWKAWILTLYKNGVFGCEYRASTARADFGLASAYTAGTASNDGNELIFGDNSSNYACGGYILAGVDLRSKNTLQITRSKQTVSGSGSATDSLRFEVKINDTSVYFDRKKAITSEEVTNIDVSSYGENTTIKIFSYSGESESNKILTYVSEIIAE